MIRFRYQPTLEDYTMLNRIVLYRHVTIRFLRWFALVLFVAFLVSPFLQQAGQVRRGIWESYGNNIGLLFLPFMAVFLWVSTTIGVKRRWNSATELRDTKDYEIDEQGVRLAASSFSGNMEWRLFKSADLARGYFLLRTAQNQYHYFPASVVPDQAALISLLQSKGLMKGR